MIIFLLKRHKNQIIQTKKHKLIKPFKNVNLEKKRHFLTFMQIHQSFSLSFFSICHISQKGGLKLCHSPGLSNGMYGQVIVHIPLAVAPKLTMQFSQSAGFIGKGKTISRLAGLTITSRSRILTAYRRFFTSNSSTITPLLSFRYCL